MKTEGKHIRRIVHGRKYDKLYAEFDDILTRDPDHYEINNVVVLLMNEMISFDEVALADALAKTMDVILYLRHKY